MKIVFLSNYYNHHQASFSEIMNRLTDGNYYFLENETMSYDWIQLGWGRTEKPGYVKQIYRSNEDLKKNIRLINDADVVNLGSADYSLIAERLMSGKLTFLYSERIFKSGYELWKLPYRLFTLYRRYGRFHNFYLLSASAYAAADYSLTLNFINKAYKWGYFPDTIQYDVNSLMYNKHSVNSEDGQVLILWTARLIDWKHPEIPLEVAAYLKSKKYNFKLRIIGTGEMYEQIQNAINEKNLEKYVEMTGAMKTEQVREQMELADLFLFTSDFNEGWGAVLNEAMNSGCAVVASHAIGAVPFLMENHVNGMVYKNGDMTDLVNKVEYLINSPERREQLGREAYRTIVNLWNAEEAAHRLLKMSESLLEGNPVQYSSGPCSKAKILRNNWYSGQLN